MRVVGSRGGGSSIKGMESKDHVVGVKGVVESRGLG